MLPMGKQLLDEDQLDTLPTRTIGGDDAVPDGHAIRRRASRVSSILSKKSAAAVAAARLKKQQQQQRQEEEEEEDSCAICLEKVQHGDMVRQLPCKHEYHCECIGKAFYTFAADRRSLILALDRPMAYVESSGMSVMQIRLLAAIRTSHESRRNHPRKST
ncbi:hypothetical protein BJV82DRAFT_363989 [Fennellomyces sp. T-0311]|nr:hypothetical protein BJV82DRAFT_363989 [Fennellomyces sp. T-0311]